MNEKSTNKRPPVMGRINSKQKVNSKKQKENNAVELMATDSRRFLLALRDGLISHAENLLDEADNK